MLLRSGTSSKLARLVGSTRLHALTRTLSTQPPQPPSQPPVTETTYVPPSPWVRTSDFSTVDTNQTTFAIKNPTYRVFRGRENEYGWSPEGNEGLHMRFQNL